MSSGLDPWSAQIQSCLDSIFPGVLPQPVPELMVRDLGLPSLYSPVAVFQAGEKVVAFFVAGEYDRDDARLLSVISRYKAKIAPLCQTVFLNVNSPGEAVAWLSEPTRAAAILAAVYYANSETNSPQQLAEALVLCLQNLLGISLGRMKDGLVQLDQVLATEVLPQWRLTQESRDLLRPLVRALNLLLRRALDEALPPSMIPNEEPMLAERVRVWKHGEMWYRFQSWEFVEDIFLKKQAGLSEAYQALYALNQNPAATVDRVRFRVLTAGVNPADPDRSPFVSGGEGSSSLRGEFIFARRTLLDQHKVTAPDLVWCIAECPACRNRSRFRQEANPLTLYRVSQAMDRIKKTLLGGQKRATFYCPTCHQPLGFEHVVLAGYAHYLADQDRDLHFLNERRPGRRRTFLQLLGDQGLTSQAISITDATVKKVIGRPLCAIELWRALLAQTKDSPQAGQFLEGFYGLAVPPMDPMRFNTTVARYHDRLLERSSGFWPLELTEDKNRTKTRGEMIYASWLGELAKKVSEEGGYRLVAFVDLDQIEELFTRAAKKLGLRLTRSLSGTLEIQGQDLTLTVDFKPTVTQAILRGHFPGVFAVRLAGTEAKRLWAGELTLQGIRKYLGAKYSVQYNPPTREVVIEGPSGEPVGFPIDQLIQEWAKDETKTRQAIIAKVSK